MSFISSRFGQFKYFDLQLAKPAWRGRTVLDFGGNVGNILQDPGSTIDHDRYWCIDVSRDAIQRGREIYPAAHWVFYDRHNFAFNPAGIADLEVPDTNHEFDYILAYSVFTHVNKSEMLDLVTQLCQRLSVNGVLAFTFIDPHFNPARANGKVHPGYYDGTNLRQRLERHKDSEPTLDVQLLLEKARNAEWCTLVNDDDLHRVQNVRQYQRNEQERSAHLQRNTRGRFSDARRSPPPHNLRLY